MAAKAERAMSWQEAASLWGQAAGGAKNSDNGRWAELRSDHCRVRERAKLPMTGDAGDVAVGESTT